MYGKRSREIIAGLLISILILCSWGCVGEPADTEKLTEIVIPASYLQFAGADAEDTAESYREYCTDSEVEIRMLYWKLRTARKTILYR